MPFKATGLGRTTSRGARGSYLHGVRKEIRQYVVEDVQLTFGLRVVDIRPYVEEKVEVVICSMGTRGELASWKQREDKRRKATRSTHIKVESQVCLEGGKADGWNPPAALGIELGPTRLNSNRSWRSRALPSAAEGKVEAAAAPTSTSGCKEG